MVSNATHPREARWFRAALQVNPFGYHGAGAPSSRYSDETSYNAALVAKCVSEGIKIIGVTDHWNVDSAQVLIKDATDAGIVVLPGFEASSSEGYHLLVLFEAGTSAGAVNAAIGASGATPGSSNGTVGKSYADILREMDQCGAVVIPAHANVPSSGLMTSRRGVPLETAIKNRLLHAIAVSPGRAEAEDQRAIFRGKKPFDRDHPISEIYADDICHADDLDQHGATTWFKLSTPTLSSIRLAIRTPETRVKRFNPKSERRLVFKSLSWTGGFLDGQTVNFAADLTTFIGGRGTGKSTLIESIRAVSGVDPIGVAATRDHRSMLEKVLGAGTVIELRVLATMPDEREYTVRRTLPDPPQVLDSAGIATNLEVTDVLGNIDVYGQHELAEVAEAPERVAEMIKRFSGDIASGRMSWARAELRKNRDALANVEQQQSDLEDELAQLPRLRDQILQFERAGWSTELDQQRKLAADEAAFAELERRVGAASSYTEAFRNDDSFIDLMAKLADLDTIFSRPFVDRAERVSAKLSGELIKSLDSIEGAVVEARTELGKIAAEWKAATAVYRDQHAETIRKLKSDGYDPDAFLLVTQEANRLELRERQRDRLSTERADLLLSRSTLLSKLAEEDVNSRKDLAAAVRKANKAVGKAVVIKPVAATGRDSLLHVVWNHVSRSRKSLESAIMRSDFSPSAFVSAARQGADVLMRDYSLTQVQCDAIMAAGEMFLREMEEHVIGQVVEINLDVSTEQKGDYRELSNLSKGQRATALLLILLGSSNHPLVIDQPEDDLDNRFVFDGLVKRLRELKGKQQIVVSTHNANVPVLGDAELIVTLEGNGLNAWTVPDATGSLDHKQVREMAEFILEGGAEAFRARQHLYGF